MLNFVPDVQPASTLCYREHFEAKANSTDQARMHIALLRCAESQQA
jgi:hypothetical protein